MFETLYRYSRVLVRHLDGPAAEERDRFVTHVAAAGAARESLLHLASELLLLAQRLDVRGTRGDRPFRADWCTSGPPEWTPCSRRVPAAPVATSPSRHAIPTTCRIHRAAG